jgi:hypothetical protein
MFRNKNLFLSPKYSAKPPSYLILLGKSQIMEYVLLKIVGAE